MFLGERFFEGVHYWQCRDLRYVKCVTIQITPDLNMFSLFLEAHVVCFVFSFFIGRDSPVTCQDDLSEDFPQRIYLAEKWV